MEKNYDHGGVEDQLYQSWENSGLMKASVDSDKPPFTIALPPPNVTGSLHLGHAAMLAVEDIMIRYKKMRGHEVLWIPGTDHAAIATETVVLKHLGLASREEMSREDFLGECRKFAAEKHDRIVSQMKKMGAWLDWSREVYTFDEPRSHAVNTMFKKLYDDGLIVRGHRMVNWSVGAQSVLSDDELEWEDRNEAFYYIQCGPFIIGTSRPETKCTDSPVVVHPEGEYVKARHVDAKGNEQELIFAKSLYDKKEEREKVLNLLEGELELIETVKGEELVGMEFEYDTYGLKRKFHVLADEVIDMNMGTGSMTISVCHDANDYALAQKHDLKDYFFQKIDFEGKMTKFAGPCEGLSIAECRKKSVELMRKQGLLLGEDKSYVHRVPLCYRSGTVVEPMISPQWFIAVENEFTDPASGEKTTLKKLTAQAVRDGHVKILPERFEKTYFQWIDNLRDWCISRQIWWGHRIPVWYGPDDKVHLPTEKSALFVRHGESEGNQKGYVCGREDFELTEKGKQQAREAAEKLKGRNITKIIASPLKRSQQTAEIIAQEFGLDLEIWEDLIEVDVGDCGNKPIDTKRSTFTRMRDQGTGESFEAISQRAENVLQKLKTLEGEGDVLLVGHAFIFSAIFGQQHGFRGEAIIDFRNHHHLGRTENAEILEITFSQAPKGEALRQDEDTLDTWFSSALWPMSPLGWPHQSRDLKKFYPTDVLETGHDILFFWVARMIMFGRYATGEYPYHTVYLHGLVCDEHGKKMSKSKGNVIDPLDVIEKVGADAVRLSLVIGTSPGNNIPLGEGKITGFRNFVNKLWNAGRFVQMQGLGEEEGGRGSEKEPAAKSLADRWILSRLSNVVQQVTEHLERYEISSAGDLIYHFVWDEFCDWYIEASKAEPNPAFLRYVFGEILKLAHPLCPFITEKLWQELEGDGFLVEQEFPAVKAQDKQAEACFGLVQNVVGEIRALRGDKGVNPKEKLAVGIAAGKKAKDLALTKDLLMILAHLSDVEVAEKMEKPSEASTIVTEGLELYVAIPFDEKAEKARLEKEMGLLDASIASLEGRLNNKGYLQKAPQALVQQTQDELEQAKEEKAKLQQELSSL